MSSQSMRRQKFMLLSVVCGLVGGRWGQGDAYEGTQVNNGGIIRGVVKFEGPVPHLDHIDITRDRAVCGAAILCHEKNLSVQRRRPGRKSDRRSA